MDSQLEGRGVAGGNSRSGFCVLLHGIKLMRRFIILAGLLARSVAPALAGFIPRVPNDPDFVPVGKYRGYYMLSSDSGKWWRWGLARAPVEAPTVFTPRFGGSVSPLPLTPMAGFPLRRSTSIRSSLKATKSGDLKLYLKVSPHRRACERFLAGQQFRATSADIRSGITRSRYTTRSRNFQTFVGKQNSPISART